MCFLSAHSYFGVVTAAHPRDWIRFVEEHLQHYGDLWLSHALTLIRKDVEAAGIADPLVIVCVDEILHSGVHERILLELLAAYQTEEAGQFAFMCTALDPETLRAIVESRAPYTMAKLQLLSSDALRQRFVPYFAPFAKTSCMNGNVHDTCVIATLCLQVSHGNIGKSWSR